MKRAGSPDPTGRLRGLGAIAHPVALLALVALVVHDVLLRPMLPAVVAGKVSDVAGLVVLPLVIAALVAVAVDDDDVPIRIGMWLTVVWFSAMKLVGVVATATARLAEVVTPAASVTVDPTDLVALPAVLAAVWVWRHRVPPRAWAAPVLVFAVMWSAATSCFGPTVGQQVDVQADGSFIVDLDEVQWVRLSPSGEVDQTRFDRAPEMATRQLRTSVCLEDGTCVRAAGHDVVEEPPNGPATTVVDIPEDRFDYARRTAACGPPDQFRPVQDMAVNDEGVLVVAHGSHGVRVRATTGAWTRLDVGGTTFTGPMPVELGSFVLGAAVMGLLLATWPAGPLGIPATFGMLAGAFGTGLAASSEDSMILFLAWPAMGVALVVAVTQLVMLAGLASARQALARLGAQVVAGAVGWFAVWAWAAGWFADLPVALAVVVVSIVSAAALSILQGRRAGSWPTPMTESQQPDFPRRPVRGGPLQ